METIQKRSDTHFTWSLAVVLGMFAWGIVASGALLFVTWTLGVRWVTAVEGIEHQAALSTSGIVLDEHPATYTVAQNSDADPTLLVENTRAALKRFAKE